MTHDQSLVLEGRRTPIDLLAPAHLANPWPDYAWLRDKDPICWHEPTGSWLISRYEHIRPLLNDDRLVYGDQLAMMFGDATVMTTLEGREHSEQRALVMPFLVGNGLERFTSAIERSAVALLDPLLQHEKQAVQSGERDRGRLDFVTEFSHRYPVDIMASMMALPHQHLEQFRAWYTAFVDDALNIAKDESRIARGLSAKQEFGDYIFPLICDRHARPGRDLVSMLCSSEVNGRRLDDEQIRTLLALMLTAGAETTDPQLAATLHALIEHPTQLHQVRHDRSLMDAALAEGMRYCTIVRFVQRIVREEFELDGTTFRDGDRLLLLLSSANHDPRRFADPESFDIHRTDNVPAKAFGGNADHLGFGGGRHSCIGARLSKRETEIALNLFLDHAEDIQLTPGYLPDWTQNALVRALDRLPISYRPV
jgi:cytochrome P450